MKGIDVPMDPESTKGAGGIGEYLPWLAAIGTAVGGFFGGVRTSRAAETDRLIEELRIVGGAITKSVDRVHDRIDDLVRDMGRR